jgi:hypothetical protein
MKKLCITDHGITQVEGSVAEWRVPSPYLICHINSNVTLSYDMRKLA